MDIDIRRASGSFYRVSADRTVLRMFDGITVPNSTAFSPDDRTLYFADTPRHVIWAFDFNLHAGMIGDRRVFADLTARKTFPDGSCVDAEGFLWNAEYGGHRLTRYAPDGRPDRTIELPVTNPTCCCFGGENLDTLYVTSATPARKPDGPTIAAEGGLLAIDVGVRGLPEAAFGG
jgi:sugar lactone lactonase YvrE